MDKSEGQAKIDASSLLKKVGIDPNAPALLITANEALEYLLDAIDECCPNLEIDKMTKEDIQTLLKSYGSCVVMYHPEGYHQEMAASLKNFDMLRHYGLTDDDYDSIEITQERFPEYSCAFD